MGISLTDYLTVDRIIELKATNKDDAIRELIEVISTSDKIKDKNAFFEAIMNREKVMSTGVGGGIAVPHAKNPCVDGAVLAMGLSKAGVDFSSSDGKPANIVMLIGVSDQETSLYLKILSNVIQLFINEEAQKAYLDAADSAAVISLIASSKSQD